MNVGDATVSVIIVNWNHGRFLQGCLDGLQAQDYPLFDIAVVDNGSRDGSSDWVPRHYPGVRWIGSSDNRGFSWAFNQGVRQTKGAFVVSLNPDVTVRQGFIAEMVRAASQDERIGMVAPKLLRADKPTILDSTGLFIDRLRRAYDRGQGEPDRGQYDAQPWVFGACGAAALYRRAVLDDLALDGEYLDEGFFAYYEDVDLSWRAQLRGWRCIHAPRAVAMHVRGWGDALRKQGHAVKDSRGPRLALRNRHLVTIRNDSLRYLIADLPVILPAELVRLGYAALRRPGVLLGILDLVRACPSALRKRRQIRRRQTVDDATVRRWFVDPESVAVQRPC